MSIWLVMQAADGSERQFSLRRPRTIIGRETTCDVRVPIPTVARKHCEITIEEAPDGEALSSRLAAVGPRSPEAEVESRKPKAEGRPPASIRLTDLGSEHGTFHNGVRVREAELSHADILVIGPVTFIVRIDPASEAGESNDETRITDVVIERVDPR